MATIKISQLPPSPDGTGSGSSQGTDLFPATDTTDTSSAASGTTKKYTLSQIFDWMLSSQGLTTYSAVRVATTGALTVSYANGVLGVGATLTNAGAQAALSIDGVTLSVADRVLVKNQVSTFQNGIYVVTTVGTGATNWVLTRATDYDQAADIVQYGVVLVNQGTVSASLLYQETGAGPWTMGTTAIVFALYTAGSGSSVNVGTANQTAYYAAAGSTLSGVGPGSAGQIYQSNGSGSAPAFTTATYPTSTTINQILYSTSNNVIGALASSAGGVVITDASSVPTMLANPTATGRFLQSVSGAASIWSTAAFPASVGAAGTILRSNGTDWLASTATFADTYAVSTLLYASGSNAVSGLAAANRAVLTSGATGIPVMTALATDGQLIIGSTAGVPAAATLTAGTGVTIANASNSITIGVSGGGLATATIAGTTQSAAVNTRYIALNAGQTTVTLPATCAVGDIVALIGSTANTGGWILDAPAGDTITYNGATTSAGGTITSSALAGQTVEVVCDVADTSWIVTSTVNTLLTTA
jgi:hypothetical protein